MEIVKGRWFALACLLLLLAAGRAHAQGDDILPQRQGPLTHYPSIEAALDAPAGETVMLVTGLDDFLVHAPPNATYLRRLWNVLAAMRHAKARNVPIHVLVNFSRSEVPPAILDELAGYPNARWIGFESHVDSYLPHGNLLMQDFNPASGVQTWFEHAIDMSRTRNVVLTTVSLGASWPTSVAPMFEAVWNRLNVYTNANLNVGHEDHYPASPLFFRRLDQATHFLVGTVPRALPGLLMEDPFLHWVPVGNIPGVVGMPARVDDPYYGGFSSDGLPLEHRYAPGAPPFSATDPRILQSPYEARAVVQVGFGSGEAEYKSGVARKLLYRDPDRSALVMFGHDLVEKLYDTLAGYPAAQWGARISNEGLDQEGIIASFTMPQVPQDAYRAGRAEVTVHGHAGFVGNEFQLGGLPPRKLAALLMQHQGLGIEQARAAHGRAHIAHLDLMACGRRCEADYRPTFLDQGLANDEVEYARELVRLLADGNVIVERVTVRNVSVIAEQSGPIGAWYITYGPDNVPVHIWESKLLTTTLKYDRQTNTFTDDTAQGRLAGRVASQRAIALDGYNDRLLPQVAGPPLDFASTTTAMPWPATDAARADITHAGGVVRLFPRNDLAPRLNRPPPDFVEQMAFNHLTTPGAVLVPADARALQAALRPADGGVVIVDSDPAQIRGIRLALSLAFLADDAAAWRAGLNRSNLGHVLRDVYVDDALLQKLQARMREDQIAIHEVDLGSGVEAAHNVNASLGEGLVLAVLNDEGHYLAQTARLGVDEERGTYLRRFRENVAFLLGPRTTLLQAGMRVEGEAAYRARVGLPEGIRTQDVPILSHPPGQITADLRERGHWTRLLGAIAEDAHVTTAQRAAVEQAMADVQNGMVHRGIAMVRAALENAGDVVRDALGRLLRGLGIVDRTSYSPHLSPQDYEATFARDGLRLGIDAAHVAEALHKAHEDTLRSAGLDPADYVPVLQSAHRPPSPCALDAGACGATLHAAVDYDIHFLPVDGREGVEVVRTRDPAFAEAHAFVEGFGVRNGHVGLVAAPEGGGGGVHTMNAAFALMGLARALEGARAHAPEVADNLATSLQVQMYLNEAQAVHGVVGDVMQVVQLAREGLQEARLAQVGAEASASMGTRLLGMAGQASRGAAMVLQGVLIGFDAYHLAHAQTEGQRAMFGTQLGLDSAGLALTLAAWTAELAGFAAVSAVADTLALPLVGIGIGVMGLVEVFSATASDVDEVARKFNRFGDLYPREPLTNREKRWFDATEANWQPGMPPLPHAPDAAELRDRAAFTYDAKTRLLSPVFGVALQEIDLRTRDALGQRHVRFAESYIDRMDMNSLSAGHLISDRNTITSMNPPRPDPKAAPIPILARMGGAPTGKLVRVEDRQAPVEVLVLPATPVSRFGGYTYNNLPFGIFRHVYDQDFMGYTVLRALEEIDWAKGVFMFDFYLTAIDHSMNHIVEALQPTPVRVLLDEQVQVVALPDFTVAPDPKYTEAQLRAYGEHARLVMGAMQYTLSPAVRTAPYTIALQAGYGRGMTLEAPASGGATWILDARHLQAPDDIRDVRLVPAGGGQPARGELTIAGMPIVVHGAGAEITAWVTMPHGVWQVDFAGGTLRSHDVLAASDLVHGQRVKEALSRKLFAWRSDSFVEVAVPAGGGAYVIHGTPVSRYYASVRDEALVHAIDDAAYPQARLVFGDASEAYYHDDHAGLLYRVPHGQVRPTHRYVIGPRQGAIAAPHALRYIDRLAAGRMLLLVEYERRPLAYLDTAWVRANAVADTVERMTAVYELEAGTLRLVRLLNHNRLSAFLEDGDRATPDGVAYAGIAGYIGSLMQGSFIAPAAAAGMATVLPQYAGFIGVRGMLQGARGPEPYQHWIRASDGWLLKPIFPGGAACGAGGAADGLKLRQAVYSAGCGRSVPGDAQLVGVYEGPSREGAGAVAVPWYRFYAPSTQTFYGTRMYAPSHAQGAVYPRTQVVGVRDGRMDDALVAADAQGLLWDYLADEAPRLRGVGAAWTAARAARWLVDLRALAEATPEVHPVLVVDGLRGPAGALSAWYLPEAGVLALAPVAQAQWVAFDGGRHVATVRDADGTLWTVPTFAVATAAQATEVMATFFEQRTLRAAPKATRLAAPPEAALVSAGARQDAQCRGVYATYANGAGVCHDGLGAPQVLELRHCEAGAALPAWPGLRVQAAALTCARNAQGAPAAAGEAVARVQRTGWRSAGGAVIAAPTDPDLADAGAYRVLGFNDAAQRAYYFHPGESLLYIADFAGTTQSRHWLEDAQVLGDGLLLRLAREPLPASAIPRIDGVDALGIASAGRRAVTYTLDAATWDHYARIVVDMGGVPAGPWRHHELRLAFGDASYLEVQRRPGGWLAQDPLTGRHVEMRGRGGNKTLVFGDRNERLDLTEVEPVRFADLPATGYRDHGYASSWAPASDRHDVNGDGVADLVRLVGNGHQKFLSWALRRADGSIGSTSEYAISSGKGFPVPAAGTRPFYAVNGQLFYCGLDLGANGVAYRMYCFEMDARGFAASIHLDFDRHAPGKVPTPADDLTWHVQDLVRRSRDWTWHNADRAHVRFDGRDLACSAVAGETACTATRPPVYNALQLARACTAAQYATPTHWCARERAKLDPRIMQEDWGGDLRRMNQGRAECATYDGRTCLAGLRPQDLDPARLQPLVCGPMHKALGIAANDPHHWCQASIPAPPPPPVPEPEGHAPVVSDLRITGTWAVGSVLTGHYAYRDADGDPEGASDYQWYVGQPGSDGVAVPVPGANQRTFTLRAEDQGAQRSVWFNVERVRAGSGVPNVGKGASVRRTGAIEGRAPQALAPSVAGVPQAGQAVTAQYRYADADGDAEAGTTFQWYRHKPGVYLHAIPGATGPAYAVQAADVGAHRLLVRITPRAATGIPATGTQVEAQTASDVIAAPHYENGTDVAIHQHLAVESPIHLYATGTASQVRVRVQLRHTCSGTLQIDLMRGGVAYPLRSASGTCPASQDMDAVFTGYASGASKYGTWSLRIRSTYGSHTGTLDRWTLDFL